MADEEHTKPGIHDLLKLLKRSPALTITVIAGGLLVIYILVRKNAASSQPSTTGDSSTVPTQQSQGSYYPVPEVYVEAAQPTPTPAPQVVQPTPAPTPAPAPAGSGTIPANTQQVPHDHHGGGTIPANTYDYGVIRTRYSNPVVATYDKNTPGGIPIRSTPGGTQTGVDAYGSQVQITGAAVSGTSNLPGTNAGTNLWYPVSGGGYVSAADVQSTYHSSAARVA